MAALLGEAREEVLSHGSTLLGRAREMVGEAELGLGLSHLGGTAYSQHALIIRPSSGPLGFQHASHTMESATTLEEGTPLTASAGAPPTAVAPRRRYAAVAIGSAALLVGAILGVLALMGDDGVSIFVPPNSARSQDDSVDDFIVKKGRSRSHGHGPNLRLDSKEKLGDDSFQIRAEDDGQNTCSFELTYDDCKKSGMCTWADGVCSESSS